MVRVSNIYIYFTLLAAALSFQEPSLMPPTADVIQNTYHVVLQCIHKKIHTEVQTHIHTHGFIENSGHLKKEDGR